MYGFSGKILRLDLTKREVKTLNTSDYEEWGGGHGMGSAIFWDLCKDKTVSGFDPGNVLTMMTSPCTGTMAPSMGARMEVQGIGPYPYPFEWFTRSNFGGRFAAMLKWSGWDGIVIEGKADGPVWINITNDKVTFEDASSEGDNLWGMDTWETQQEIWRLLASGRRFGEWQEIPEDAYTTQRPAVVAIGPCGENLSRIGCFVHDAGDSAGKGGFGGVWGAKNLKAISVRGTGSVDIADPEELVAARLWLIGDQTYNVDDPEASTSGDPADKPGLSVYTEKTRTAGCFSCFAPCRRRTESGVFNDSQCHESYWYPDANTEHAQTTEPGRTSREVTLEATDLVQKYGVNATDINAKKTQRYLLELYKMGVLGLGKAIESYPLDFAEYGTARFARAYIKAISYREGIGDDLAEGVVRAAKKWGRLDEDLDSGLLPSPQWGYMWHWSLPSVEWAYASLMEGRDVNTRAITKWPTRRPDRTPIPIEDMVNVHAEKTVPFTGDPFMFDYGEGPTGIYSEHRAKQVAWFRRFSVYWLGSMGGCEWRYPRMINTAKPDLKGFSPYLEERILNAVTGKNMSYTQHMEIARKILNLDRAIHVLQGRHRDNEKFAPFVFKYKDRGSEEVYALQFPFHENGVWDRKRMMDRFLDYDKVEEWKTHYYDVEGWDKNNGWPTRATLQELGLDHVADELESQNKLGT
ncbi:MAG: aldehyde ferredoxin oxidoreductase N-terminal domain-containing protein [Dehalococcoidales bacterium]|jgi:aldehyde:ferredoxin oxidoreductase|nr:aldehyde ferredoxin oxidoreductase N-terminal domain-containing protein [Dehalococcoidales bacterium]